MDIVAIQLPVWTGLETLVDRTQQHTSQRQEPGQENIDMQEAERTERSESRQSGTGGEQGTTQQESPPKAGDEQCPARAEIHREIEIDRDRGFWRDYPSPEITLRAESSQETRLVVAGLN